MTKIKRGNMKKIIAVIALTLAIGCRGKTGDKGDAGLQGIRGPGRIEILTGTVTSNDFTVTDSRISQSSDVTVLIGGPSALAELPYFLPTQGINTFDVINLQGNQIEIVNAQTAGAAQYAITLILQ